ncbi:MAG: murein hydrolase activator EnvC family protein [Clostridium sp.]|uniref:murein hydrolase activator EnvC family protein n=1 Tax=Clostridium sp. TaxID=1506 RepID=UPI003EE53855
MSKKKICAMILIAVMATPLIGDVVAHASTKSQNQINQNKNKINNLEEEKKEIEEKKKSEMERLSEIMKEVDIKTKSLDKHQRIVDEYTNKINKIDSEIQSLQNKIIETQNTIETTEVKIKENEEEKKVREEILGERLSSYYKMDMNAQFIHMVFSSQSVGELISTIFNIDKIIKTDQELITEIKLLAEELDKEKKSLEENKVKIENDKKVVESSKIEQEKLKTEAEVERNKWKAEVDGLEAIENEKRSIINNMENREERIEKEIGDLVDFNKELQKEIDGIFDQIGNQGGAAPSSSGFMRPSSYGISSQYGPRVHPVTGDKNGFHTGTDFAAPYGATTVAANSGTVVFSGVMSGYGNTVVIDHGGGVQTLYAHASQNLVSSGQKVSKGQAVAKVGSTGQSTGPHLHFEVRVNGRHTNPMNYIS